MCPRRKSQQAEREYEKIKSQLEGLEESVRDRCKKEFTGRAPAALGLGWARWGGGAALGGGRQQSGQSRVSPQT